MKIIFLSVRLAFTALFLLISSTKSACPPNDDCGPFGVCITDSNACTIVNSSQFCERRCSCYPGYYGDDCSFVVEICPASASGTNGQQMCFNGGTCVEQQVQSGGTWVTEYTCNCATAAGDAAVYAGSRCEFPGETSCEAGMRMSSYAFCVNGGRCIATVQPGQPAAGCDCVGLFEGRHCQYAYGTAPPQELLYAPARKKGGLSGGMIFLIVLLSIGFLGGMFFWMYRKSRADHREAADPAVNGNAPTMAGIQASMKETEGENDEHDLALEEVPIEDEKRIV